MTKRVENLEQKIAQLQAQLTQAKAIERVKDRKRRTRQSIIGFTTLQACLENGIEIHLKTPDDLLVFLKQHVKGTNNRKTWGFEDSDIANDNRPTPKTQSQQKKTKKQKLSTKAAPSKVLPEGPNQEDLMGEFNL